MRDYRHRRRHQLILALNAIALVLAVLALLIILTACTSAPGPDICYDTQEAYFACRAEALGDK